MEVKAIEGLGKAVDAILVNGRLKTNDIIVLGGQNGPICTHVKQIFTPPANKDQFNTVLFHRTIQIYNILYIYIYYILAEQVWN